MNQEIKTYRPEPNEESMKWAAEGVDEYQRAFRNAAVVHNMMSRSQIGRPVFVVVSGEGNDRLAIQPPLSEIELSVLSKVPYFRSILQEVING